MALALLIHAALIAALTWGVNWKRTDTAATFGAELWSNVPSDAAPIAPVLTTPPAPPVAVPLPAPVVKPPVVQAPPEPTPNVDIALEQEKSASNSKTNSLRNKKLSATRPRFCRRKQTRRKLTKRSCLRQRNSKQSNSRPNSWPKPSRPRQMH